MKNKKSRLEIQIHGASGSVKLIDVVDINAHF
jgi:hypothetical protein